ncbi:MAG: hypothetical protein M1376_09540 [Planctomycetes bacterium]|nr:hypothetical protein [Planctomycetota bacterium]
MHRRSKRILTGLGIFLVALAVLYALLLVRATSKLRRAYADLEADGRPMRIDEITPPKVPDSENAAVLYQSAVLLLKSQPAGDKSLFERLTDGRARPKTKAERDALIAQETVTKAVSLMEQGTRRPVCQLDRNDANNLDITRFPEVEEEKLGFVLRDRAQFEIDAGNRDRAWDLIYTQLRFADSLRWIPVPWTQQIRQIRIARACRMMQDLCETAPPDGERYRALEELLKQLDDVKPFIRALDAERLLIGERFFSLSRDELSKFLWKQMGGGSGDALPLPVVKVIHRLAFTFLAFKPRLVADHAAYLQLMNKRVQLLQGPYRDRQEAEQFLNLSHWNALTTLIGYSGGHERRGYSGFVTALRLTRAGLALLQYKQAHGTFPEKLDALGLEGLSDPYAEGPLHYRPEGQGFVVYSVGEDRKDNDGTPQPERRRDSDPRAKPLAYDEVWRFPNPKSKAAGGS